MVLDKYEKITILLFIFIAVFLLMTLSGKKTYHYGIEVGSENVVEAHLGQGNYFYKIDGTRVVKPLVDFPAFYYRFLKVDAMGKGEQVATLSNYNQLPDGVALYWYAPYEDEMWKAQQTFDPRKLQKLENYMLYDAIDHQQRRFMDDAILNFVVNIGAEGRAAVWISGSGGESYLLESIQGEKDGFEQWNNYRIAGTNGASRYTIMEERLSRRSEEFQRQFYDGKLDKSATNWDRQMRRYRWKLLGNENFTIENFFGYYTNGEQYFQYENQPHEFYNDHAAPVEFIVFVKSTDSTQQIERLRIYLDRYEVLDAFESLTQTNPNEPLSIYLSPTKDLSELAIYVASKSQIIELVKFNGILQDMD